MPIRLCVVCAITAGVMITGCSSSRWMQPSECALIGGGLGLVGGVGYATAQTDDGVEDWALGLGVGGAGGALLGYAFCAIVDTTPRN